jgi:FMN phosphatase YigB (HAD superfamily)
VGEVDQLLAKIEQGGYRNLIFDLDQTITHLLLPWDEWKQQLLVELSPQQREQIRDKLWAERLTWAPAINALIEQDRALGKKLIDISRDFEARHPNHTPYPALVAALPGLKKSGHQLLLWTNNNRPTAKRVLTELGVLDLFSKLVTREDSVFIKPHLAAWHLIKQDDQPLSSYLYIGDSQNDRRAAGAASIDFFQIKFFKREV